MEKLTISAQHTSNFQFLSVCHYINSFGIFFYNQNLITLDQRNQTVPILNTYFQYLNNSQNENEAKLQLLKKVLKGSDLYGGGENETLDKKYVEETYQYIISTALFSHYGNINGYLAKIINTADDITYSALKKNVFQHLSRNYTTKDYCSPKNDNYKISSLAIEKIFQNNIWSIFPEPEKDTSIMDVDYIYAMVGLKISRSVSRETLNISYHDYILIARELDLQENYTNETYEMILTFYSTSALFFYAYNEKEIFRENKNFQTNEFWIKAYETLFLHINSKMHQLTEEIFANNLHYKLEKEISELKTRTFIATNILWKYCNYSNYDDVSKFFVALYKTCQWIAKRIFYFKCKRDNLPILENVYEGQFKNVKKIYNQIEVNLISNFLVDNNLVEKINSNVTIISASVLYNPIRFYNCPNIKQKLNNDIYVLFQIEENNKKEFYAIKQEKTGMTLLVNSGNEQNFSQAITNLTSFPIDNGEYSTILKKANEDYKVFIKRFADIKTKEFVKNLIENYRNETAGEHIIHFAKSLIPFYSCIESIKENDERGATISCMFDVLSLIPIAGVTAKYGEKLTETLVSSLSKKYLIIPSFAKTGVKTLMQISKIAARTVAEEILTKSFLKDLSVATLRTIDPGFELTFQLSRFGIRTISNSYRFASKIFLNPSIIKSFQSLESIVKSLENTKFPTYKGLLPKILHEENNYQVVRFYYPGGENTFGPTCLSSYGTIAELRTIEGNQFQVPVVPIIDDVNKISPRQFSTENGKISYRQFSPESGKISTVKLEMTRNDLLRKIMPYLNLDTDVKITRNYQVYHNTIEWHKTPTKEAKPEGNLNQQQNPLMALNSDTSLERVPSVNIPRTPTQRGNLPVEEKLTKTIAEGSLPSDNIPTTSKVSVQIVPISKNLVEIVKGNLLTNDIVREFKPVINPIADRKRGYNNILSSHQNPIDKTPMKKIKPENLPAVSDSSIILRGSKPIDNIPETLKISQKFFNQNNFHNTLATLLMKFKHEGLFALSKQRGLMIDLRKSVEIISRAQIIKDFYKQPIEIWFSPTFTSQSAINTLKNLKGKNFYFNDITYLTTDNSLTKTSKISLNTEVRYHMTFNSYNGLVDLAEFDIQFKNQYIVFPEVNFYVADVKYFSEDGILQLDLIQRPIAKKNWIKLRERKSMLLGNEEIIQNERSKSIENAAYFLSINIPLHRFSDSKRILKQYILNNGVIKNSVPTYDKLAYDIYAGRKLSQEYENYKIINNIFIDDVLFQKSLYQEKNLESAKQTINKLYGTMNIQNVESLFEIYQKTSAIHQNLLFKDYYGINLYINDFSKISDIHVHRRLLASLYRLALRQCEEKMISNSITLYSAINIPIDIFRRLLTLKEGSVIKLARMTPCYTNEKHLIKNWPKAKSDERLLLYQFEMNNQAGIIDVNNILSNSIQYVIPSEIEFKKGILIMKTIEDKEVNLMKLHDDEETSIEARMVKLINSMNKLLSTETEFYINNNKIIQ
ncbi:uncharacterized protein LOC127290071 [Leptopilina boulardi]|uniref:uncharacterized protein LOC127290071 n=1 Tax=Leptopilina boulardi TaxID=63433 RepID=UPI0021F599A0|nr:uncharacterized protein LOC127290071 [Leptopilina boulardi]XP_051174415.1 uncharacterized protein LOC127290071 [Leptopilina boulardi]